MSFRGLVDLAEGGSGLEVEANHNWDKIEGSYRIISRTDTAAPGSPTNGDAYIPAATVAGGDPWEGQEGNIAVFSDGWLFFVPFDGLTYWIVEEQVMVVHTDQPPPGGAALEAFALMGPSVELVDGANIATNTSLSNHFLVVIDGNRTLDNPNFILPGVRYTWEIVQDAVTGSRTLSYGTEFEFPGGTSPTLSTGVNDRDVLVFDCLTDTRLVLVTSALNVS